MSVPQAASSTPGRSAAALPEGWLLVACLAGGLALGSLWALAQGVVVDATDAQEQAAASDSVLALLGAGFGLVSGLLLAVLPGRRQVLRAGVSLLGTVGGAFVALATGLLLGAPPLRADGIVLVWPIVFGAVTSLRLLVMHFLGRE